MTPRHSNAQPPELPIKQVLERLYLPDMPEKFEMIHGKPFWEDRQCFHVHRMLIEFSATDAVEAFTDPHRQPA